MIVVASFTAFCAIIGALLCPFIRGDFYKINSNSTYFWESSDSASSSNTLLDAAFGGFVGALLGFLFGSGGEHVRRRFHLKKAKLLLTFSEELTSPVSVKAISSSGRAWITAAIPRGRWIFNVITKVLSFAPGSSLRMAISSRKSFKDICNFPSVHLLFTRSLPGSVLEQQLFLEVLHPTVGTDLIITINNDGAQVGDLLVKWDTKDDLHEGKNVLSIYDKCIGNGDAKSDSLEANPVVSDTLLTNAPLSVQQLESAERNAAGDTLSFTDLRLNTNLAFGSGLNAPLATPEDDTALLDEVGGEDGEPNSSTRLVAIKTNSAV